MHLVYETMQAREICRKPYCTTQKQKQTLQHKNSKQNPKLSKEPMKRVQAMHTVA